MGVLCLLGGVAPFSEGRQLEKESSKLLFKEVECIVKMLQSKYTPQALQGT